MKHLLVLIALLSATAQAADPTPPLPLKPGRYTFQHRFAEHPGMNSIKLTAKISGDHIVLVNRTRSEAFPKGVVSEGTLMWHAASKQWIIGKQASDRLAEEVGGCTDGPEVVDLKKKIYWTC